VTYNREEKVESFQFDDAGEEVGYISLMQARVIAIRHAQDNPDIYPSKYAEVLLVWELLSAEVDDDYYHIKLSWRASGRFEGKPGVEEFIINKIGSIEIRQLLDEPLLEPENTATNIDTQTDPPRRRRRVSLRKNQSVSSANHEATDVRRLTNQQLIEIGNHLNRLYKPMPGNGITAWCLLIGHASPSRHSDAQEVAKRYMNLRSLDVDSVFSATSCWHSTPGVEARRFTGNKARYDSKDSPRFGPYKMWCIDHGVDRSTCLNQCLQGLYDEKAQMFMAQAALNMSSSTAEEDIEQDKIPTIGHPPTQVSSEINRSASRRSTSYVTPNSEIVTLPIVRELNTLIGDILVFGSTVTRGEALITTITQVGGTLRVFSPSVTGRSVSLMWDTNIARGTIRVPAATKLRRCLPDATIPINNFRDIMSEIGVDIEQISGLQSLAVPENRMIEVLGRLTPVIRQLATFYEG
jgi:hypothetical protein